MNTENNINNTIENKPKKLGVKKNIKVVLFVKFVINQFL